MTDTLSPAPSPTRLSANPHRPRRQLPPTHNPAGWPHAGNRRRRSPRQRLTRPTWTKVVVALLFGIMVAANGNSVAEEQLVDVTGELDQAEAALAASEDQVGDLEEELSDLEEELGDLKGELDLAERARDDAGEQLEELEAELADAEDAGAELEDVRAELASANERVRDLEDQLGAAEAEAAAAESAASDGAFGDGVHVVGEDIEPGTYRTDASQGMCYWARLSGLGGGFEDIITNGIPDGPATVQIHASDAAFESTGCGQWSPTG